MTASKKKLHNATENSADIMDTIATGNPAPDNTPEPKEDPKRPATQSTRGTKYAAPGYYRFNLNMPIEYKDYLTTAAYNASRPGHIVSVTEYICTLIKQDMDLAEKKEKKAEKLEMELSIQQDIDGEQ